VHPVKAKQRPWEPYEGLQADLDRDLYGRVLLSSILYPLLSCVCPPLARPQGASEHIAINKGLRPHCNMLQIVQERRSERAAASEARKHDLAGNKWSREGGTLLSGSSRSYLWSLLWYHVLARHLTAF
jgi:hypothetical protein